MQPKHNLLFSMSLVADLEKYLLPHLLQVLSPLIISGIKSPQNNMVRQTGFEPVVQVADKQAGFSAPCLTIWLLTDM